MKPTIDIDAYFHRVAYDGDTKPTRGVLEKLHLAHATHIPFENLDILLGRPIRLDAQSLEQKLVRDRRGGYCFEHNLLFADVLEQLGFKVRRLAARVRVGHNRLLPRTHMTLFVDFADGTCLADVGFGADGLLLPVPVVSGAPCKQFHWSYRLVASDGQWVLQVEREDWTDMYAFTEEEQYRVDYEVASYYTSTHPDSRFTQTLTAQIQSPERRHALRGRELVVDDGATISSRTIEDDDELLDLLRERFGLSFPPETRFPTREPAA